MIRSSMHPMAVVALVAGAGAAAYWALSLLIPRMIPSTMGWLLAPLAGLIITFAVGFIASRMVDISPVTWSGIAGLTMSFFILLIGLVSFVLMGIQAAMIGWGFVLANTLSIALRVGIALLGGLAGTLRGGG